MGQQLESGKSWPFFTFCLPPAIATFCSELATNKLTLILTWT